MLQKMILVFICFVGFIIPVGIAGIAVCIPNLSNDYGLPEGFEPTGSLTVYYTGGG